MDSTAPVRQVVKVARYTGHVAAQMDQFYSRQNAMARDTETTVLVILCTKTNWIRIDFNPGIYDLKGAENK